MRKFKVIRLDDIDGNAAASTVRFAYQGKAYEIDLSKENVKRFDEMMSTFISRSRTKSGTTRTSKVKAKRYSGPGEQHKAREWARSSGVSVGDRGRVPATVMVEYRKAKRKKEA